MREKEKKEKKKKNGKQKHKRSLMKVEPPLEVDHGPGDACGGVEGRKQLLSQLNSLHFKNLIERQNKNTGGTVRGKTVLNKTQ